MYRTLVFVLTTLLAGNIWGAGSGMSSGSDGFEVTQRTPEQLAASSYNDGLKHKKRALSYEQRAASSDKAKDRAKYAKRARDQFERATEDYRKAIGYDNRMYQAMNELGFAYRKLGDHENSIRAYNTALQIEPAFAPAIEYRAEAYLELGHLNHAKAAYMELYRIDQAQAGVLMQAFDAWLATNEDSEFSAWVAERKQLASLTQAVMEIPRRDW